VTPIEVSELTRGEVPAPTSDDKPYLSDAIWSAQRAADRALNAADRALSAPDCALDQLNAHPSGFTWSKPPHSRAKLDAHPSGFTWSKPPHSRAKLDAWLRYTPKQRVAATVEYVKRYEKASGLKPTAVEFHLNP